MRCVGVLACIAQERVLEMPLKPLTARLGVHHISQVRGPTFLTFGNRLQEGGHAANRLQRIYREWKPSGNLQIQRADSDVG